MRAICERMREIGEESFITSAKVAEREWYLISRLRERETIGDGNNHVGTRGITLGGGESGGRRKLRKTSKRKDQLHFWVNISKFLRFYLRDHEHGDQKLANVSRFLISRRSLTNSDRRDSIVQLESLKFQS